MGSLAGSGLADSLGRKTALLLDAVPLLIGALVSATSTSLTSMVMGRIFCGIGIGLASALVPLYISEVSTCQNRALYDRKGLPPDNTYRRDIHLCPRIVGSPTSMVMGCILHGIGIGLASALVPLYVSLR